ncbi:MAG TPA: DUF4381 family protein [Verrucomicrobiota bacterium]|nr:hypothetical protein [Verrucomicrobiales bacterium]HRI13685.1 DUF4381 family protein [Verrucomicrobiota bacterium]
MNRTNLIEDLTLMPLPPWWQSPWLLLGLVVVAGVAVLVGRWLWRRWVNQHPAVIAAAPQPDLTPEFLERLAALRARRGELSAYELAIECSDLLREFVEWRFRMSIRFQTTREFLEAAARDALLGAEHRDWLGAYLKFCDLVKFAQQGATEAEQTNLLDAAERFIRQGSPWSSVATAPNSR